MVACAQCGERVHLVRGDDDSELAVDNLRITIRMNCMYRTMKNTKEFYFLGRTMWRQFNIPVLDQAAQRKWTFEPARSLHSMQISIAKRTVAWYWPIRPI